MFGYISMTSLYHRTWWSWAMYKWRHPITSRGYPWVNYQ